MTPSDRCAGRLNLLYVISGLGPGGSERSFLELLPHYLASGIRPGVVCFRQKEKGVEAAVRALGCDIRYAGPGGMIARVRALRRLLRTERIDLIHTTLFEADVAGRLAARGTGIPVLTSLVNTSYEPVRLRDPNVSRAGLWVTRMVDGWTARHLTTHFHAVTEAVKVSAVRALRIPADRITVVERGRAPERLSPPSPDRRREARRRLGLSGEDEVVVNVARQEYQKGQRYLVEAAAILARTRPRLVVLVAGREGHLSSELVTTRDRLGLCERLRFLGHRDDVPEVLAAADVFAFPSLYEGIGGAAIEAMALGLPIVASDIPGLREVIEDGGNGFLVRPESPSLLASALARLLDDRALASAFGARSLALFQKRFTIDRIAERMVDLYYRVASVSDIRSQRPSLFPTALAQS